MPFSRGDRVLYRGEVFYIRPNGNSCYLHRTADFSDPPAHTPTIAKVQPAPADNAPASTVDGSASSDESRDDDLPVSAESPDSEDDVPYVEPHVRTRTRGWRFFYYVVRTHIPSNDGKAGVTNDIRQRLAAHRTLWPTAVPAIVVDMKDQCAKRKVETPFIEAHKEHRVGKGEVFTMSPHAVETWLRRNGFEQTPSGVFQASS